MNVKKSVIFYIFLDVKSVVYYIFIDIDFRVLGF